MRIVVLLLVALLVGAACSEERSARCREVCKRGERCAEAVDDPSYKFDEDECAAACAFLEKDAKGAEIVDAYVACVDKAGDDCSAIRRCD